MTQATQKMPNLVDILEGYLEIELRKRVTDILVSEQMDEFEKKLRERIRPEIEAVTLGKVRAVKDLMRLRDELFVTIEIDGDKTSKII